MPSPRFLHVLNGDSTRGGLERAGVPGTFAVWADALHEGPVPGDDTPVERWREARAHWHAAAGSAPYAEALALMRRWDEALERFAEYDEVVIWCEHDLFDQLLLIRHLAWFARRGATQLSLICIGEYPGVAQFKGLGQLTPRQLAPLLEERETVMPRQLALGTAAWRAVTSSDPTDVERFLQRDSAALPFLAPALRRLLEEYPWTRDGLSRTERHALELLSAGPRAFGQLFPRMHDGETAFYIADASLWTVLRGLGDKATPAIMIDRGAPASGVPLKARLALTPLGRSLLAGRDDWVKAHGVDRWVGGVHLAGRNGVWRWDERARRLRLG